MAIRPTPSMPTDPTLWFVFRGRDLLVRQEGERVRLPEGAAGAARGLQGFPAPNDAAIHRIGSFDGWECLAAELPAEIEPPAGHAFEGLRRLWSRLDEPLWRVAGRAVQIVAWDRD